MTGFRFLVILAAPLFSVCPVMAQEKPEFPSSHSDPSTRFKVLSREEVKPAATAAERLYLSASPKIIFVLAEVEEGAK